MSGVRQGPRILTVAGGKGGVGTSTLSVLLAGQLARAGARVLLVDLSLSGGNLHTLLGLGPLRRGLGDMLSRPPLPLEKVCAETSLPGLRLLASANAPLDLPNLPHASKGRLLRELGRVDADWMVWDVGSGTDLNTLDFFLKGDSRVLVGVPEHCATERSWRFLRAAGLRWLRQHATSLGRSVVDALEEQRRRGALREPADALAAVAALERDADAEGPAPASVLDQALQSLRVELLINGITSEAEAQVVVDMRLLGQRRIGCALGALAAVPDTAELRRATRRRALLSLISGAKELPALAALDDALHALGALPVARQLSAGDEAVERSGESHPAVEGRA